MFALQNLSRADSWQNSDLSSDQNSYKDSLEHKMSDAESSIDTESTSLYIPDDSADWQSFNEINVPTSLTSTPSNKSTTTPMSVSLTLPTPSPDRKYSVPAYSTPDGSNPNVKMRDKTNSVPSRPSSLIEAGGPELKELKIFEIGNLGDHGGRDREHCRTGNGITHAMNEVALSQRHRLDGSSSGFGPSIAVHGSINNPRSSMEGAATDRVNIMPSNSTSTSRGSSQADLLECGASASTSETPKSPLPGTINLH